MLSSGSRALDRTGRGLEHAGDHDACFSVRNFRLKLEGLEEWGMNGARHRRIDPPVGRPLIRLLAVHDGRKRGSLLAVRSLIDDSLTLAVALVDRSRPTIEESRAEAIERDVSKVTFIDANGGEAAAVSVCGAGGLELARTGEITIAIADLNSLDVPVNVCHGVLLPSERPPGQYHPVPVLGQTDERVLSMPFCLRGATVQRWTCCTA